MRRRENVSRGRKESLIPLNNWAEEKVAHRDGILEFDLLVDLGQIVEIEDGYYCLSGTAEEAEQAVYEHKTRELMEKHNIKDMDKELKGLIKKLNYYNEIKDIAQTLIGRIAELRGTTIKSVYEELGLPHDD